MDKKIEEAWLSLQESCRANMSGHDLQEISRAFDYAFNILGDTSWPTGEIILVHAIEVARIVSREVGLGTDSVISGLLHNVAYEGVPHRPDFKEIGKQFGPTVSGILEGMAKINALGHGFPALGAASAIDHLSFVR